MEKESRLSPTHRGAGGGKRHRTSNRGGNTQKGGFAMIQVGKKAPDFIAPAYRKESLLMSSYRNILANGLYCASIPVISHLFELPKFQQLPKNIVNSRSLV